MYSEMESRIDPDYNPSAWDKEDFGGVDPGESSRNNNDIDE